MNDVLNNAHFKLDKKSNMIAETGQLVLNLGHHHNPSRFVVEYVPVVLMPHCCFVL